MDLLALPLGISSFRNLREEDRIYVDKTDSIFSMIQKQSRVFLARPGRFGKTLLVSTLDSLFSRGLQDFHGLKIEELWKDEKQYKVVRLDFSKISSSDIEQFEIDFADHLIDAFGQFGFEKAEYCLPLLMGKLSRWLNEQDIGSLVLLVDEYDFPLTASSNDRQLFRLIQEDLAQFFSIIKSNDSAFRFSFITGTAAFDNTEMLSAFNNLSDISLIPEYGDIVGYSHNEVKQYFPGYVEMAAKELNVDSQELFDLLIRHYDGFCFEESTKVKVFAPWPLLNFFSCPSRGFRDSWFGSAGQSNLNIPSDKNVFSGKLAGAAVLNPKLNPNNC